MQRIRFVGDSATCAWLGVTFERDKWVPDHGLAPDDLDRVAKHPHFEVEGVAKTPKSKA
jgi:hypothetical protein